MTKKIKICIVAHNAYGAIVGDKTKHIGGVEIQTELMSRWLSDNGYLVDVITWDEGNENPTCTEINNIKVCKKSSGIPGVKFFYPRWTRLIKALKESDSDIYYHNCAEYVTGQVAIWAKLNRKKFVYSVASDPECDKKLPELKSLREKILFKLGLKFANKIIVQTGNQQKMLQHSFGLASNVIPMPSHGLGIKYGFSTYSETDKNIIWVGRFSKVKNIELLFSIASKLSEYSFHVVGGEDTDKQYASEVTRIGSQLNNVSMHGKLNKTDLNKLYKNSHILCCTSVYEGFPNTFLEAWSYGIPIVSTVDPDDLINKKNLGMVFAGDEQGIESIKHICESQNNWERYSQNARDYFYQSHELNVSMKQFDSIFKQVVS
jgi:glycosyltransferase involved in cell wall biosynthesis